LAYEGKKKRLAVRQLKNVMVHVRLFEIELTEDCSVVPCEALKLGSRSKASSVPGQTQTAMLGRPRLQTNGLSNESGRSARPNVPQTHDKTPQSWWLQL
jgi:hypothetical protein